MKHIAVMFALPMEARGLINALVGRRRINGHYEGRIDGVEVRIGISGIGHERSAAKAREMFADHPQALIVAGFAGGLDKDLSCGDLVAADYVLDGGTEPAVACACHPCLQSVATQAPHVYTRQIISTLQLVRLPNEKADLCARSACAAVDMESSAAASVARDFGVPFQSVRVILDGRDDTLPYIVSQSIRPDGRPRIMKVARALLSNPGLIKDLAHTASQSRNAVCRLTDFLVWYLPRIAAINLDLLEQ